MTGNNQVMSELRFSRLSAVKTPDELLRQLRAVRLLNGVVNLLTGGRYLPLVSGKRRAT
jgi:CRISPR system Cascade subunit CasB